MAEENISLPVEKEIKVRTRFFSRPVFRVARFLIGRIVSIAITIIVGIYITVCIANRGGFVDASVRNATENTIWLIVHTGVYDNLSGEQLNQVKEQLRLELYESAGLNLSPALRNLRWTYNALTFQWGNLLQTNNIALRSLSYYSGGSLASRNLVKATILTHFPNTVLLIATADLLVFLFGIPLALFLSRKYGTWLDKVFVALSPISSIPAWVHGIFLVIIFAVQLQWLPPGKMFDLLPPATKLGYIPIVLKHMILPVTAIVLSMVFQYIYTWRTFFLIYASEDYVDLARAKGLPPRIIERRYLLRPTLPYVVTSFAMALLGFWQMTTALEYFFQWPGIGMLYVQSLGVDVTEVRTIDALLIIGVVVIFAYLMGLTILLLDIAYAALDPRVRVGTGEPVLKPEVNRRWWKLLKKREVLPKLERKWTAPVSAADRSGSDTRSRVKKPRMRTFVLAIREVLRYPSAIIGIVLVFILVALAVYAVIAIPPSKVTEAWYAQPTGVQARPQNARPVWVNWFLQEKLPETITLDTQHDATSTILEDTADHKTIESVFTVSYPYGKLPEELYVYFTTHNTSNPPFASLTWVTPDGREFEIGNMAIATGASYKLSDDLPQKYFLPGIRRSTLYMAGSGGYPIICAVFYDPAAEKPCTVLPGTYTLRIVTTTFEPESTVDAKVVLMGQLYGIAGTDYFRRDLSLGLLWGLPIALALGLVGAVVTTFLSMLVAATGVWFGGWVDGMVQRITEANMILPVLAIGVLIFYYYDVSLWVILGAVILLNVFGSTTKTYRAAFLQVKETPYIEAARAYGASSGRMILGYMVPRVLPVLIPQLVSLIPAYVFLEATLGIFWVADPFIPTWGSIIRDSLKNWAFRANYFWIGEPVALLLITGLAFAMLGFALDRILNPRLRDI
jgi:peptide/nickel transport system permease protein